MGTTVCHRSAPEVIVEYIDDWRLEQQVLILLYGTAEKKNLLITCTVQPVYKDHPWENGKLLVVFIQKVSFRDLQHKFIQIKEE